ncbi:MAG: hypothetical protein WCY11_05285 [Novosphingobium sp.]
MKDHFRAMLICGTLVLVVAILAIAFRYKTYNKSGSQLAVYDRWTGEMTLCNQYGCFSQDELRKIAEDRAAASEQEAARVAENLAREQSFDIHGARAAGYTDVEITGHLREQASLAAAKSAADADAAAAAAAAATAASGAMEAIASHNKDMAE